MRLSFPFLLFFFFFFHLLFFAYALFSHSLLGGPKRAKKDRLVKFFNQKTVSKTEKLKLCLETVGNLHSLPLPISAEVKTVLYHYYLRGGGKGGQFEKCIFPPLPPPPPPPFFFAFPHYLVILSCPLLFLLRCICSFLLLLFPFPLPLFFLHITSPNDVLLPLRRLSLHLFPFFASPLFLLK